MGYHTCCHYSNYSGGIFHLIPTNSMNSWVLKFIQIKANKLDSYGRVARWQWTATHRVVDWGMTGSENTELTFPLAVRGFHIYTLTRLSTTDWKATESKKRTQQHRGQICLTGKKQRCWRYWFHSSPLVPKCSNMPNDSCVFYECWMTIMMDCLDKCSKYVVQKAEPIWFLDISVLLHDLLSWSSSNQHTFSMVAPGYIMV